MRFVVPFVLFILAPTVGPRDVKTLAGPIVNPANGNSYYLLPKSTWQQAEAMAVRLGGHLVTINDKKEQI